MRGLLFVRSTERTDLSRFAPEVERIRQAFDRYLDSYPIKTDRTKTSLMGPVGKILGESRSGKWDKESLAGYALNIHLMNPNARGYMAPEARAALYEGTEALLALLSSEEVPPAAQDKLIDQIDYGLYWIRRRKRLEFMEQIRGEFIVYLRGRYATKEALNQAWGLRTGDQLADFENGPYPSRNAKRYRTGNDTYRSDVDEFLKGRGETAAEAEEEEE